MAGEFVLRQQLSRLLAAFVLVGTVYKPATALNSPSDDALQEIVVTAQRRSPSLQSGFSVLARDNDPLLDKYAPLPGGTYKEY